MTEIITPIEKIEYPLRAVIFDIDGTIFPTMNHYYNLQKMIYDKLGDKSKEFLPYSDEWMDNYNEILQKEGIPGLYNKISYTNWDKNKDEIWKIFTKYNKEHTVSPIVQNGKSIIDIIKNIHHRGNPNSDKPTRLRLGINTTKTAGSLYPLLEKEGVVSYFDTIIDYDAITRSVIDGKIKQDGNFTEDIEELRKIVPKNLSSFLEKPNFLSTSFALNGLNTSPRATIVFEDSINGLQSCKTCFNSPFGASVYVVGVTWGFVKDKQKLIDAGADAIMNNITEIEPFIEYLGGFHGERRE